jgi:hypothetical protein
MKSELLEKDVAEVQKPNYSEEEEKYISALQKRLYAAKEQRDQSRDEWDGQDYLQQYEANEKAANTFIQPKKNKEDTNFQSGIIRQKLFALLSALTNLNLTGDISAYDRDGLKVQALGDAMEDIIAKADEMDNDDEKKFLRHYELLKQGTVFVEESWMKKTKKVKTMKAEFDGKIKGAKWDEKMVAAFARPSRSIIPGPNVYLGDISVYDASDQPYLFTVDVKSYEEAESIFGEWERWVNVPKNIRQFTPSEQMDGYGWTVTKVQKDEVEIVRYQDKWNNETAILLNGVLMTPIGLPLPYGLDEYTIAQQNLEPIHSKFAYGKSLVARVKNKAAILDEFLRLGVLKTQKSFMPPYINLSGRMLTNRVFMPGKISHGIPKDSLVPINDREANGITSPELAMINEIKGSIDSETTSPIFSGQPTGGDATATEIVELQRQAKMVLGLTIFSVSLLEWKLEWLRLKNIIANWFKEEKTQVVGEKGMETKFRPTGVERLIEGEGTGRRVVVPTKFVPESAVIEAMEKILSEEQGTPLRLIFINPDEINFTKLFWQINVTAREKKSSEVEKLLFRAEMADAQLFGDLLNRNYLAERFANVWQEDPQKMFRQQQDLMPPGAEGQAGQIPGAPSPAAVLPTAEKALGRQVSLGLGVNS